MNMLRVFICSLIFTLSAESAQNKAEPSAPAATATVQRMLDEAAALAKDSKTEEALRVAERAVDAARATGDSAGEALAHRHRALRLQDLKQVPEAVEAWGQAAIA